MKKITGLALLLLVICHSLFAIDLTFNISNRDIDIQESPQGILITQENSYYSGDKDSPAIPLLSFYFEIPEFTRIKSVEIIPQNEKIIPLTKDLLKEPEQVLLSNKDFASKKPQKFAGFDFPQSYLYNSGSSISGSKNIAFLAVYACSYKNKTIIYPKNYTAKITLMEDAQAKLLADSRITREVHKELGFSPTRELQDETYLLIYPQAFSDAYTPLVHLREKQGLRVITKTTESIFADYPGLDNAEKIRNYIIDEYQNNGLDYVTLGADVQHIPHRYLWAFDCNFGLDNENNIPGDMYYANLNGNWNANQNNLFGEDSDGVDLFPEVIVARVPVIEEVSQVQAFVDKLIAYEMGYQQDYTQALGLSQNLWDESNSVYTQEYIQAMYYPDYINNVILNEDENTVSAAQENFNRNPNIIQHTGHCFWSVIALGNGTINESFVNEMQNDYAGVMYSIGCWAAALDYNAIAEKLVRVPEHGITSFVGNSRYGWGSPTADGFGFSEFYQKEFFRLLFQDKITNISLANQLQKIPFTAYLNGTSVYKWCSYQLNTLGDSYFNLFIDQPKEFNVDYYSEGDNYTLFVSYNQEALDNVVITLADNTLLTTNAIGQASFVSEPGAFISLYKKGFKIQNLLLETTYASNITDLQIQGPITPNTPRSLQCKIKNGFDIDLPWTLKVKENENILGQSSGNLTANLLSDWIIIDFDQPNSEGLTLELSSTISNEILAERYFQVDLAETKIVMTDFNLSPYPLVYNDYNFFSYCIKNSSNYPLTVTNIEYLSDDLEIGIVLPMRFILEPGQETILSSDFSLIQDVDIASLAIVISTHNEYWDTQEITFTHHFAVGNQSLNENFEIPSSWYQEDAWQRTTDQAYSGEYSLTCYPSDYGTYDLILPLLTYTDDLTLSFMYKYKMPMYGQDGFSIFVNTDDFQERIIFLGSGGALVDNPRDPEDFIFSDWSEYSLTLGDLLLNKPDLGQQFSLSFSFTYIEDASVTNNYLDDPELGIFLDNMRLTHADHNVSNDSDVAVLNNHISLYPNPLRNNHLSIKHNSKIGDKYQVSVYNLKGQRVSSYTGTIKSLDKDVLQVPIFQRNRDNLSSGIYFVKYKTVDSSEMKKILFLK